MQGVYVYQQYEASQTHLFGVTSGSVSTLLSNNYIGNAPYVAVNSQINNTSVGYSSVTPGLRTLYRSSSDKLFIKTNINLPIQIQEQSVDVPNGNIYILCSNNNGTPYNHTRNKISAYFSGA